MGRAEPGNGWERGGQPGRGPNASTMEQSWVCAGGEEQIEIFTDSKGKSEEKNILSPGEWWCRRAPGLAPLLEEACLWRGRGGTRLPVTVLLPLSRLGLGMASCVLCTPGGAAGPPRWAAGRALGCRVAPLQLSILLRGYPEGFPAIHPARWQLAELWRARPHGGGTVGTPRSSVLAGGAHPCGAEPLWMGWPGAPRVPEPTRVPRHSTSLPRRAAPWGCRELPAASLLPNPALSLLEPPLEGSASGEGPGPEETVPLQDGWRGMPGALHAMPCRAVPGCVCGLLEAAWRTPLSAGAPGSPAAWHTGRAFFFSSFSSSFIYEKKIFFFFLYVLGIMKSRFPSCWKDLIPALLAVALLGAGRRGGGKRAGDGTPLGAWVGGASPAG